MKDRRHGEENLQRLLRAAYHSRAEGPAAGGDGAALMRRIAGPPQAAPSFFQDAALERLFWRLAPAAGVLIAVMIVLVANLEVMPDAEIWPLLSFDNAAAAVMQSLFL